MSEGSGSFIDQGNQIPTVASWQHAALFTQRRDRHLSASRQLSIETTDNVTLNPLKQGCQRVHVLKLEL
jgi:hypothetical protein